MRRDLTSSRASRSGNLSERSSRRTARLSPSPTTSPTQHGSDTHTTSPLLGKSSLTSSSCDRSPSASLSWRGWCNKPRHAWPSPSAPPSTKSSCCWVSTRSPRSHICTYTHSTQRERWHHPHAGANRSSSHQRAGSQRWVRRGARTWRHLGTAPPALTTSSAATLVAISSAPSRMQTSVTASSSAAGAPCQWTASTANAGELLR